MKKKEKEEPSEKIFERKQEKKIDLNEKNVRLERERKLFFSLSLRSINLIVY